MATKYLIGIDNGSQSSKVVIYDLAGRAVAEAQQPLRPSVRPAPGIVLHPGDDLWESICVASRAALAAFRGDPADILGVGLCTIRCCKAFLKRDGGLVEPVMSWMDSRAYQPYLPDNPALAYATTSSGYITHRFTGRFCDTAANNIEMQWPVDTDTWQWSGSDAVLRQHGLRRDMLFELVMPGTAVGAVTAAAAAATGIPAGLPVVATANDKAVEALGSGSIQAGTALVSLGTYIAAMVHGQDNRRAPTQFWTNFGCVPHTYLYESHGIRRGMWTLSWFMDLLGPEFAAAVAARGQTREQCLEAEASDVAPGSDGLMTVLDWLAPGDHPYRKGLMLGFDARHTRGHIYRSILEAIALTMQARTRAMCDELGVGLREVVVSGGGSRSALFMQIFADAFGIPASRAVTTAGASLGAAICAAVATHAYPGFAEAVAAMAPARETFSPDAGNAALYARLNDSVYQTIRPATDPVLARSFPLFN